jgi:hypothetical protein
MRRPQPALFAAGDTVTFTPISLGDYEAMLVQAASGELVVEPDLPSSRELSA